MDRITSGEQPIRSPLQEFMDRIMSGKSHPADNDWIFDEEDEEDEED